LVREVHWRAKRLLVVAGEHSEMIGELQVHIVFGLRVG